MILGIFIWPFFFFSREKLEAPLKGLNFETVSQEFMKSHVPVLPYKLEAWKACLSQKILVHSLGSVFHTGNT